MYVNADHFLINVPIVISLDDLVIVGNMAIEFVDQVDDRGCIHFICLRVETHDLTPLTLAHSNMS